MSATKSRELRSRLLVAAVLGAVALTQWAGQAERTVVPSVAIDAVGSASAPPAELTAPHAEASLALGVELNKVSLTERSQVASAAGELLARVAPDVSDKALGAALGELGLTLTRDAELDRIGFVRLTADRSARAGAAPRSLAALLAQVRQRKVFDAVDPNYVARTLGGCCDFPQDLEVEERRVPGLDGLPQELLGEARVVIALLDTGVDGAHPDLLRALLPPIDLIGKGVARAIDLHGHGTAQAGVLISSIDGHGVVGIAPGARVLPVRVAHRSGEATQADLARGLIAAADRGANIILIPMGAKAGSEALHEAVRYATNRGSLIIASVGNEVTNHALYPAAYEEVLAVGASDFEGQLAYTTVLGPAVDVYAPGEDLPTTHRRAMHGYTSGTSAAASYTAGVAALLMSAHPAADAVSVAQAIRASARPIEALGGLESMLPAGTLDPAAALARLGSVQLDLSVAALEVAPARPLPGSEVVVRVKVRNDGGLPVSGATLAIRRLQAEVAVELTRLAVPSLAPGRETTIEARVALGEGLAPAQIEAQLVSTDDDARRDRAVVTVTPTQRSVADVAFTGVTAIDVDAEGGALTASFVLTNRGNQRVGCGLTATDTHGVAHVELGNVISAGIADEASEEQAAPIEGKRGRRMGNAPLTLAPGERREVRVRVRRRLGAPLNVASLRVTATTVGLRDSDLASNQCGLDWSLPDLSSRSVKPQYQQAGDMDWVVDAPWRITAGRTYVPLLVFLPEKGDPDPATYVEVERMRMLVRDPAQAPGEGVVIYEDTKSAAPSIAPSGLVMLDEEARQIPGTDIFEDQQIQHPGHYRVLRVPTGALGVTAPVFQDVDKDLEVQIDWSNNRFVFLFIRGTRTGTHRKSLRVGFASRELASIGEGQHYDAHFHTINEWYKDSSDLLAPMRNYGAPLPMLHEAAYAIGMIPSPVDTYERIATTDHNCFNNTAESGVNTAAKRPTFGPTSVASSTKSNGVITTELERMREIYGRTAGEEVAIRSQVGPGNVVPLGGHMLVFGYDHVEGPWHGGSNFAETVFGETRRVEMHDVLLGMARKTQAGDLPFAFAAHPFDANPWSRENVERSLGLGAFSGDSSYAVPGRGFVYKGLQVWNERQTRSLTPRDIDFDNMHAFDDPAFQQGDPGWDAQLVKNLAAYQRQVAELLEYRISLQPGTKFPRKHFMVAGTDAHGDFNYTESRTVTQISLPVLNTTYDNAFGKVRTYALTGGRDGAGFNDRAYDALQSGASVVTDGPIVAFTVDANGRFDGEALRWVDATLEANDEDGRIGGGGPFDGQGTALCVAGDDGVTMRYRYEPSAEGGSFGGEVRHLKVYRTRPGDPNPTRVRTQGNDNFEAPIGAASITPLGPSVWHQRVLQPAEEGLILQPTALQLGAFTGLVDPDFGLMGADERRCYTNPLWVVPVEALHTIARTEVQGGVTVIPAGALEVEFKFGMSMNPRQYAVEVKALSSQGESTDRSVGPIARMIPARGWSGHGGGNNASYSVTNEHAIPLNVDRYPNSSDVTFCVYFAEAPEDAQRNSLNKIAFTFRAQGVGSGGGVGAPIGAVASGGTSSSSGCAYGEGGSPWPWWAVLLVVLAFARRRALRRRGAILPV